MAIRIEQVDAGSEAEALGLAPGDELLSVDDNELNDTLDYDFYTDSSSFHLKEGKGCRRHPGVGCPARGARPLWLRFLHLSGRPEAFLLQPLHVLLHRPAAPRYAREPVFQG